MTDRRYWFLGVFIGFYMRDDSFTHGQACSSFSSVTPVKVCTNTVTTGSNVYMDFYDAKDHLSCNCSVTFIDSGTLQVTPAVYPNYIGCGTVISISLTDTFRFKCKQSGGSSVNVLPGDVMLIQIDKERDFTTSDANYCVILSSGSNAFNFTVSCTNSDTTTFGSSTATSTFAESTETLKTSVTSTTKSTIFGSSTATSTFTASAETLETSVTSTTKSTTPNVVTSTAVTSTDGIWSTPTEKNQLLKNCLYDCHITAAHLVLAALAGAGLSFGINVVITLFLRHRRIQRKQVEDTYMTQSYGYEEHNYGEINVAAETSQN